MKLIYSKSRGFTLIEMILVLAIGSIVTLSICTLLDFSIKTCDIGEQKDDLILNGRYGIEYIKNEIRLADKIISTKKIKGLDSKYVTNLGFIVMIAEDSGSYRYITYYIKNSNLVRIACTRLTDQYPNKDNFGGHNTICEFIHNTGESKFEPDQSMVFLDFNLKHRTEEFRIKADIHIRCPIDF